MKILELDRLGGTRQRFYVPGKDERPPHVGANDVIVKGWKVGAYAVTLDLLNGGTKTYPIHTIVSATETEEDRSAATDE